MTRIELATPRPPALCTTTVRHPEVRGTIPPLSIIVNQRCEIAQKSLVKSFNVVYNKGMEIKYHTKNFTVSDKFRGIVEKKLEKIKKYFGEDSIAVIVLSTATNREKMELTITSGGHAFRAQEESRSMFSNIDGVLSKIERQVVKNKERLQTVVKQNAVDARALAFVNRNALKTTDVEVKKNKSFAIKTLSDKEAELNLATLDHDFFVYADEATGGVRIMYRRPDNHVGVIDITNATAKR